MVNKGPLTTVFSPAASCRYSQTAFSGTAIDWSCHVQGPLETDCFPPKYGPSPNDYFSPETACPLGYLTDGLGCSMTRGRETIITCCPKYVWTRLELCHGC